MTATTGSKVAGHELDLALARLCEEFAEVPSSAVASLLGDSYQVVVDANGDRLVDQAEELARLRLEVRTRHPARRDDDGAPVVCSEAVEGWVFEALRQAAEEGRREQR